MCQAYESEHTFVVRMEQGQPMCAVCRRERASFVWGRGMCAKCDMQFCANARIAEEHIRLSRRISTGIPDLPEGVNDMIWHPKPRPSA
jgi:hypothetical protein